MKQIISISILIAFTSGTFGCSSSHSFLVSQKQQIKEPQKVYRIQTTDGNIVDFESDSLGYAVLSDTTLQRLLPNGTAKTIPLSTVKVLYTKGYDPNRTGIAILMGVGLEGLIVWSMVHGLNSASWN